MNSCLDCPNCRASNKSFLSLGNATTCSLLKTTINDIYAQPDACPFKSKIAQSKETLAQKDISRMAQFNGITLFKVGNKYYSQRGSIFKPEEPHDEHVSSSFSAALASFQHYIHKSNNYFSSDL